MGGLPVAGGKKVKPRKLLRSGELCGMTDEEKSILAGDYGLAEIVDFRSAAEAVEKPDAVFSGVSNTNIDIMASAQELVVSFSNFESKTGRDDARRFMMSAYDMLTKDANATRCFRRFFGMAAKEREGALLFHCFAGKDRTGVTAAFILKILGADTDVIYEDYLKTNGQRKEENAAMLDIERKQGKAEDVLLVLNEFLVVRREYLEHAFKNIDDIYGGFDNYVKNALGLSDSDIGRMKEMYLV